MTRLSGRRVQDFNAKVYEAYGMQCYLCGVELLRGDNASVDHIKPVSIYPELELDVTNARPCCLTHNMQKSNKTGNVRMSWVNEKFLDWKTIS